MYRLCSENKGADQLRENRTADLRLCFRIVKKAGFLMMWFALLDALFSFIMKDIGEFHRSQ